MILSIDIGNSNINIGAYCDGGLLFLTHIVSEAGKTEVEYAVLLHHILHLHRLSEQNLKGAVISSVVPQLSPVLKAAVQLTSPVPVMQIGPGVKTGLNIRIDNPAQLGADFVAAAVGAFEKYPLPVIIVDFGTATTYGVISAKSEFLGGAIGPGLRMMNRALSTGTAKLPSIELVLPPQVIGKTTVSNIQAGILYGYIGSVEKIVGQMKLELGGADIRVIATGGMAHLVKSNSDVIDEINPDLTLTGLRLIYERNL